MNGRSKRRADAARPLAGSGSASEQLAEPANRDENRKRERSSDTNEAYEAYGAVRAGCRGAGRGDGGQCVRRRTVDLAVRGGGQVRQNVPRPLLGQKLSGIEFPRGRRAEVRI